MRRFIMGLIIGVMLATAGTAVAASRIALLVNGKAVISDQAPQMIGGSVFVPLRVVAQSLGANVNWDAAKRTVVITLENNEGSNVGTGSAVESSTQSGLKILSYKESTDILKFRHLIGEVQNTTTNKSYKYVKIVATAYDASNNIVATSTTYASVLPLGPEQKSPFEIIFTDTNIAPDHYSLVVQE